MKKTPPKTVPRIDLHGLFVDEAREFLRQRLISLPRGTREVDVIHGYNGGDALKEMVKNFKHERIDMKFERLNKGVTTFTLKY